MSIEWISKNKVRLRVSVGSRQSRKTYSRTVEVSGKKDAKKKHDEFQAEVAGGVTPQRMTVSELVAIIPMVAPFSSFFGYFIIS